MAFPVELTGSSAKQPQPFQLPSQALEKSEGARVALRPNRPQTRSDQLAERKAAEDNALLREIDDAVRHDQLQDAAKRYGIPLISALVAGLLGFGGYLWWYESREGNLATTSEELVGAIDTLGAGHTDTADKELAKLAGNASSGGKAAADMLRAGIALREGRAADAIKLYDQIAKDGDVPAPYRDLATIRGVATNFDAMKSEDVVARLKPLAVPGNPWFGSAGELVGAAYLKQGKNDLAGPLFASIAKDKDVPETLRSRARQLAGMLGYDAITDAETFVQAAEVAAQAPAPAPAPSGAAPAQ